MARAFLSTLFFLVSLAACDSGDPARFEPLPAKALVLAFGDSLTHGTGAGEGKSYPSQLEELTGLRVIRAGVPGETTAEGLRRLPGLLARYHPDLVILIHGGNDILQRLSRAKARENMARMIALCRDAGAQVALVGVPAPAIWITEADELYPQLAEDLSVPYEPLALVRVLAEGKYKSDPVHPNATGYRKLAEDLAAFLKEAGAL